jgi:hypothetical protein
MAKSPLTKGLTAGKTSGLIGNGMTVNPALDNTNTGKRAKALLGIHQSSGVKAEKPKSGPTQMNKGVGGRKESGGGRITGGRI